MPGNLPLRQMDCVDCHSRPSHAYELPDRAVDRDLSGGGGDLVKVVGREND